MSDYSIKLAESTLNKLRFYVAEQSLRGHRTSVRAVLERIINRAIDSGKTSDVVFRPHGRDEYMGACHDELARRIRARGR